jgi:hypothetical protein
MLGVRRVFMAVALLLAAIDAFQSLPSPTLRLHSLQPHKNVWTDTRDVWSRQWQLKLKASLDNSPQDDQAESQAPPKNKKFSRVRRLRKRVSTFLRKRMVVAVFVGASMGGLWNLATPQSAQASAPVMAVPKAERRDAVTDAMLNHERRMVLKQQQEMQALSQKAREIEVTEGTEARIKFEKEYKLQKDQEAKEHAEGLVQLKRSLLDQGICPFTNLEGQRQVIMYEKGLDLGKVPGTMMYLEKQLESGKQIQKSAMYKQTANRRLVKAIVQDLKNKGLDPLEYFEIHKDKTQTIMVMSPIQAAQLVQRYEANLEQYGQIDVPKEGEMSVKEKMEASSTNKQKDNEAKMKEKEEQKRAKALAAAAKQQAKAEARAAKEAAKQVKADAKASEKAAKAAEKAAAAAMVVSSVETGVEAAESVVESSSEAEISEYSHTDGGVEVVAEATDDSSAEEVVKKVAAQAKPVKKGNTINIGGKEIGILPLAGLGTVVLGGGGYTFKIMQEKSAEDAKERERQFRLLMGMNEEGDDKTNGFGGSAPALELMDKTDGVGLDLKMDKVDKFEAKSEPLPKKGKKRLGFFGKKSKNNRESDLVVLVSEGATAPQFALLLAKMLTYGAPGRFPNVVSLPGKMPFTEYDSDAAKQQLVDAREDADITLEESAEVFANVVNCMLIDIVDLASSTLQAKDEKLTVEGIGVVIDFMNHAASLYEAVAGGTIIEPVTYGGDLSKGQLEKMYSAYAASGMANMDGDFDSRLGLLQDAFQVSEKKAQGLAMKAMQKNMMNMMKSGDMEEMMKQFGGEGGLEGLEGLEGMMGDDTDPEKLKESLMMLKQMKDSGSFDPSELEAVKGHFKEMYGNSIDEVIKEGEQNGVDDADRELLKLMKDILED